MINLFRVVDRVSMIHTLSAFSGTILLASKTLYAVYNGFTEFLWVRFESFESLARRLSMFVFAIALEPSQWFCQSEAVGYEGSSFLHSESSITVSASCHALIHVHLVYVFILPHIWPRFDLIDGGSFRLFSEEEALFLDLNKGQFCTVPKVW